MLFIITFFLIFGWKVNTYIDISAVAACALSLQYLLIHKEQYNNLKNPNIIALFLLTIYSLIIVLSTGITDLYPFTRAARALVMIIASFSLYSLYQKHYKDPILKICEHIYLSIFIHSILMIIMYCSDSFRLFIYSFTHSDDYANLFTPYLQGYRIGGLTYGLSQTSVLQMFGLVLIPVIYGKISNKIFKFFLILSITPIVISSMFGGRSGLFFSIFLLPLYLLLKIKYSKFNLNKRTLLKIFLLIIISFITLSSISFRYLPPKFRSFTLTTSNEIIDVFKNKSKTFNDVMNMYFMPKSMITTIFGMGNYGRTKTFNLPSDVGWIKSIFAIGIIGVILMLFPFIWGISKAFASIDKLKDFSFAVIIIFLASIMLNCKELALLTRNQWTIQAIFLVILSNTKYKKDA
ncbi:MAG: hypothetical protein J6Z11_03465 [Candidatus Riflebacteria bacterium]|nr:hypothetical protein [Candidatus Riflebacteria bacterium]